MGGRRHGLDGLSFLMDCSDVQGEGPDQGTLTARVAGWFYSGGGRALSSHAAGRRKGL